MKSWKSSSRITAEASEDIEAGYVVRYEGHAAGDSLDYGSSITVVVSTGPAVAE